MAPDSAKAKSIAEIIKKPENLGTRAVSALRNFRQIVTRLGELAGSIDVEAESASTRATADVSSRQGFLPEDERETLLEQAIEVIGRIQAATSKAFERDSIASRLAFDEAKLSWELNFFFEHYFGSYRKEKLTHGQTAELKAELNDIAAELAAVPRVLCHRDYHTANLMLDSGREVRVVDHQDARMGPASYDLVSLLMDRQPETPSLAEVRAHRLFFLDTRRRYGLEAIDPDDFGREFRLMTIQRGLKAVGTFSCQTGVYGRGAFYERHIQPTFRIVLQAAEWLERFPVLQRMIKERI